MIQYIQSIFWETLRLDKFLTTYIRDRQMKLDNEYNLVNCTILYWSSRSKVYY